MTIYDTIISLFLSLSLFCIDSACMESKCQLITPVLHATLLEIHKKRVFPLFLMKIKEVDLIGSNGDTCLSLYKAVWAITGEN